MTLPRTTAILNETVSGGRNLGAQLTAFRGGRSVADLAIGEARPGVPMTASTSLFWFSCCKPVGAVAIAQLLERGALSLDDPVARHIPEFARNGKEAITLFHVLTHTGGFRGSNQVKPDWGWDEILRFTCEAPLEPGWVPGRKAGYHAVASWFLLGEIIRRVDGRPYERYVREEIFEPIGMPDSWIGMPSHVFQSTEPLMGWLFDTRPGVEDRPPFWNHESDSTACRPGGNGRGPTRDLVLFLEMLRNGGTARGGRILREETVALLAQRHRKGMFDETFQQPLDWGLGFLLFTRQPGDGVMSYGFGKHASERTFGHGGMQSSIAFVDPVHELSVAWICNGMCGERLHRERNHAINTALYEDLGLKA
ncbi:MAG: beta-lactamase family protein [Verrucomicrobia bacterium]|nr:beta-lactamase family protein [Verrucomicrobiota bacterium]MBI3870195.1 beta-lactamase family protein [Verrucomicrobiota bacterium]